MRTIIIGLFFVLFSHDLVSQEISPKFNDYIIGTWIPDEDGVEFKWVFSESQLTEYADGKVLQVYNYTVSQELSQDGTLTFNLLELVDQSDFSLKFNYIIDDLNLTKLTLIYSENPGDHIYFTRQL